MADTRRAFRIGIASRALSTVRMARPLVAAVVLLAAAGQAHATTIPFTGLGTFSTGSLSTGDVTVTGSANVNVNNSNGLGIVGGLSSLVVNFGQFINFTFTSSAVTDVELEFGDIDGYFSIANTEIEAFEAGGASLGTQTLNLFSESTNPWDISALFGDVPLESFTLTPLRNLRFGPHTSFRLDAISFNSEIVITAPEPSTVLLLATGLAAMAVGRRRRI